MEIKRLRCLALEMFNTFNNPNSYCIKEKFSKTTILKHRCRDIRINQNNTTKYGNNYPQSLGLHIWNSFPSKVKEEKNYDKFKNDINDWFGLKFKFNMCPFLNV